MYSELQMACFDLKQKNVFCAHVVLLSLSNWDLYKKILTYDEELSRSSTKEHFNSKDKVMLKVKK
jgi:hypothetical protein